MKFRVRIDVEKCKGCALCVVSCLKSVLKMSDKLNAKGSKTVEIVHDKTCGGCRQCADMCPEAAVEIVREDDESDAPSGSAATEKAEVESAVKE